MKTDYECIQVLRSRNNGEFWSNLTSGQELTFDSAWKFMQNEMQKHPSDMLKLIKVQSITVRYYNGNDEIQNKLNRGFDI